MAPEVQHFEDPNLETYFRHCQRANMKNFWESAIKSAVLIVNFLFALGKA